jgi:CBS-domain-containing membrane protein
LELRYETWLFDWVGAFGSFFLLGAVMSTSTVFQDIDQHPINLGIFSIFTLLLFGVSEFPFAQPRKLIPGYIFSAFVRMAVTRVLALKLAYRNHSDETFFSSSFGNVDLPLAMSFFAHFVLGTGNST